MAQEFGFMPIGLPPLARTVPVICNLLVGVVVPIQTFPSARTYIREVPPALKSATAILELVFATLTPSPKLAVSVPSIQPAKFASAIVRFTSREAAGVVVPIQTFPLYLIRIFSARILLVFMVEKDISVA